MRNFIQSLQHSSKVKSLSEGLGLQFGFNKMFLVLTEVNKVIAISSRDGSVIWSHYFGEGLPEKILVRKMYEKEIDTSYTGPNQ